MSEWINVNDRLPERGIEVLVAGQKPGVTLAFIAIWTGDGWNSCDEAFDGYKVTHWMAIPELPKIERRK